jgi:hypothetical protein
MRRKSNRAGPPLTDNVLLCAQRKEKGRYFIWALDAPDIKAEAATLEGAEELLVGEMWRRYDLDEPFGLKYDEPTSATLRRADTLLKVAPNEVADASEPARYFQQGFCSVCQSGKGARNTELLLLEHLSRNVKSGLIVRFQPLFRCGMRVGMRLLHTRICDKLKRICDPLVEFREVRVRPNRTCDLRELIPKRVIPEDVPATRKDITGGVCAKCGAKFIYAAIQRDHSGQFVTKESAEVIRRHGVAAIGDDSNPSICVTSEVWRRVGNSAEAAGLVTSPVGELSSDAINRRPRLEKITSFKI